MRPAERRLPTAIAPEDTSTTSRPARAQRRDLARDLAEDAMPQLAVVGEDALPTFTTMRRARVARRRAHPAAGAHAAPRARRRVAPSSSAQRDVAASSASHAFAGGARDAARPAAARAQRRFDRRERARAPATRSTLFSATISGCVAQPGGVGGELGADRVVVARADRGLRAARCRRRAGARARACARRDAGSGRRDPRPGSRPRSGRGCPRRRSAARRPARRRAAARAS